MCLLSAPLAESRSANTFGQLGLGSAEGAWGDNPNEMGDALPFVVGAGERGKVKLMGEHLCVCTCGAVISCPSEPASICHSPQKLARHCSQSATSALQPASAWQAGRTALREAWRSA